MAKGIALITGASSGIGEALARHFAEKDFDLIITARRQTYLQQLASDIESKASVNVQTVSCDLAEPDGFSQLLASIDLQTIDILVNNAGVAYLGTFQDQDYDAMLNLLSLNINATTKLIYLLLPLMIEKGAGRILNVASMAAFHALPSMTVYAASKAFVLSLTESLSVELQGTGVSATALCPGLTQTKGLEDLQGPNLPPLLLSSPEEVAEAGFEALMNREVIVIPGMANQAAAAWAKHQPRWLLRGIGGLIAKFNPNAQR